MPTCFLSVLLVAGATGRATASDEGDLPDLDGHWAQKVVQTSLSKVPVVGDVTSRTTTYLVVEVEQNGRNLELKSKTCDVAIDSDTSMVRTILPDRFADAIATSTREARIAGTGSSMRLVVDRHYYVLGASLREPKSERLPTYPDDPRVRDVDGDGHPGVTVRTQGIVSGEIYVVQRAWDRYEGNIVGSDRIDGRTKWHTEQKVLDATNMFLQNSPDTLPHPDPSNSYFEMVRVSGDTGCNRILRRREALFRR